MFSTLLGEYFVIVFDIFFSCIIYNLHKEPPSSLWTGRIQCRHCNTEEQKTQEHIEKCTYFAKQRGTLNLDEGGDKLIFWRKVIYVLKCLKLNNKDLFDHKIGVVDSSSDATRDEGSVTEYSRASFNS